MLAAGTVIDHARDLHPAFGPERSPPGLCLRFLSRYQQALVQQLLVVRPQALALTTVDTDPAAVDFLVGLPLPTGTSYVAEVRALSGDPADGGVPVTLVPSLSALLDAPWPAATLRETVEDGPVLALRGCAADWAGVATVRTRVVVTPDTLAGVGATLTLPSDALGTCVAALGAFLAARAAAAGVESINPAAFEANASGAEQTFLVRVARQGGTERQRIRRVV